MKQSHEILQRLSAFYPLVQNILKDVPGVKGVSIGITKVNQTIVGDFCWKVYVDASPFNPQTIPRTIKGIPTQIIPKLRTNLCFGEDFRQTLVPGIQIEGEGGNGTLGCFARLRSDPTAIVLLSNHHVLFGNSSLEGRVAQPSFGISPSSYRERIVATNVGDGLNGWNQVTVTVTNGSYPGTYTGSEIDCAVARLNGTRPYSNDIPFIGMITGTPQPGDLGVNPGDVVHKLGARTGPTTGTVLSFAHISAHYEGDEEDDIDDALYPFSYTYTDEYGMQRTNRSIINFFIIIPTPDPENPDRGMYFAETGDSGAVVVNERHQVIGLLTGRINFTVSPEIRGQLGSIPEYIQSIGIVIPIHNVLEALDIEIPPDLASTEPTRGSEIGEGIHPLTDLEERLQEVRKRIFSQLSQVPLGKAALEKIEEHQQEVVQLVHHHRPVKVVYHRNQGPAFASHLFKSLLYPLHVIPGSVDGISRQTFITQLSKALKEYGSAGLKADIDTFFPIIMKHVTNIDGIESFIELLVKEYKTQ